MLAVLGAADADLLFGAVDAVDAGDARAALLAAARLADSGRDVGRFFGDLEAHLRGLMIVQTLGEVPDELKVTAEQDERLAEQARRVGAAAVLRLLDLVANALRAMKDGADPRTQLELALIKGARPEHDPSLRALMARLERLEGRAPAPARRSTGPEVAGDGAAARRRARAEARAADAAPQARGASRRRPRRPPSSPPPPRSTAGPPSPPSRSSSPTGSVSEPEVRVGVELDLPGVTELWPAVLADVQERSPMLHALMRERAPVGARPTAS